MIEKTTKIGELLEKAPEKAQILLDAGMHCLGCPASQAETPPWKENSACESNGSSEILRPGATHRRNCRLDSSCVYYSIYSQSHRLLRQGFHGALFF